MPKNVHIKCTSKRFFYFHLLWFETLGFNKNHCVEYITKYFIFANNISQIRRIRREYFAIVVDECLRMPGNSIGPTSFRNKGATEIFVVSFFLIGSNAITTWQHCKTTHIQYKHVALFVRNDSRGASVVYFIFYLDLLLVNWCSMFWEQMACIICRFETISQSSSDCIRNKIDFILIRGISILARTHSVVIYP